MKYCLSIIVTLFIPSLLFADVDPVWSSKNFYVDSNQMEQKQLQSDKIEDEIDEFSPIYSFTSMPDDTVKEEIKMDKPMKFFSWDPQGQFPGHMPPECQNYVAESKIKQSSNTLNLSINLQKHLDHCLPFLTMYQKSHSLTVMLKNSNVNYPITELPLIRRVSIFLGQDELLLKGLLIMRTDGVRRPLIIIKCGIYCNAQDSGNVRNYIMHFLEEGDFNVLFLANVSGTDYLKDNGVVAVGGFDEGDQIMQVAEIVKDSNAKLSQYISDIHVLGFSLGGNGALFSSLYNSFSEDRPISSVAAICPVVNLQPTMESVFSKSFRGFFYRILTASTMKQVFNYVPTLRQYLSKEEKWTRDQLFHAISESAFKYYAERTNRIPWERAPFKGVKFKNMQEFWDHNNFIQHFHSVNTPTLVMHSTDDYLVQSEINSSVLQEKQNQEPNPNLGIIHFSKGNHCAFGKANGWGLYSTILRNFFIKNSRGFIPEDREKHVSLQTLVKRRKGAYAFPLFEGAKIVKQVFEYRKSENELFIRFKVFHPDRHSLCDHRKPFAAPNQCYKWYSSDIPWETFSQLGLSAPDSTFARLRFTRWLNVHSELRFEKSSNLGTTHWPNNLVIFKDFKEVL